MKTPPKKKPSPKPNPFEKTKGDVEIPGKGKEGSKKEEAFDRLQKKTGKSNPGPQPFPPKGKKKK